jgi:predicted amidohydrolase
MACLVLLLVLLLLLLLLLRRYNAHVVLDASGSTAASYRKVHLFDVDVPNGPVLMESRTTAPGDKVWTQLIYFWWIVRSNQYLCGMSGAPAICS